MATDRATVLATGSPVEVDLPLSHAQRRFLMAEHFGAGEADNIVIQAYVLNGPLLPEALEEALQRVVARHPALRSIYPWAEGSPVQRVLPAEQAPLPLERVPLSDDLAPLPVKAIAERVTMDWWESGGLPLDRVPPVRARLIPLPDGAHLLGMRFHHIAFDGWSEKVFLKSLWSAYRDVLVGRPPAPSPNADDFSHSSRECERLKQWVSEDLPHWRSALADPPDSFLPAPRTRGEAGCREVSQHVPPDTVAALLDAARRCGAPPTAVLLAAAGRALGRTFRVSDLCVGTLTSGRFDPHLDSVVGYFVNPLAVGLRSVRELTAADLLLSTTDEVCLALEHARTPFDELVRILSPFRERHPWFQAWVILQTGFAAGRIDEGLSFESLRLSPPRTSREWCLQVFPLRDGGWELVQQWRDDGIDGDTATAVRRELLAALDELAGLS